MSKFSTPDSINSVAEFHETFNHPILDAPQIPSPERCQLRVDLIAEELDELRQAIADGNMVEVADALADIQYVLSGAVLEFGLADKFKTLFDEVHRSNMSKSCNTEEEAKLTVDHYKNTHSTEAYYLQRGEYFNVYRTGDNKTLKNVNYSPADLAAIVNQH
jgi:predicted HAD superfamily Cof-like phosphohydrolase